MERKTAPILPGKIKDYFFQNRWSIVLMFLFAFMAHGSILFSQRFGIDTEWMMNNVTEDPLGRSGLYWLEDILGLEWFNLYYAQVLTFLFLALTPAAFGLLFHLTAHGTSRPRLSLLLFGASFLFSPLLTAHIYFICQSAQIMCAYMLIAAALLLADSFAKEPVRKWYCALLSVLLMSIIFGCYQVLALAYVVGAAAIFLLRFLKEKSELRQLFRWIALHAGCFLVGLISYLVIANLFYGGGDSYLTTQIAWTHLGLEEGLRRCISAIRSTLTTNPPYYSGGYGFFSILFLGVLAWRLITFKEIKRSCKLLLSAAGLFLVASSYIFMIFMGGDILDRLQLAAPLSQSCMIYLTAVFFPGMAEMKKPFMRAGLGIVSLAFAVLLFKDFTFQLKYCSRLYYTDEWVFRYDTQVAERVYADLQEVIVSNELEDTFDNYMFWGSPDMPYPHTSIMGHTMGFSFFQFETQLGIAPVDRTRPISFMRNMGYSINSSFSEGEKAAYHAYFQEYFGEAVAAMPSYPVPGYIQYLSNDELGLEYVVIKLGDSWRVEFQ